MKIEIIIRVNGKEHNAGLIYNGEQTEEEIVSKIFTYLNKNGYKK